MTRRSGRPGWSHLATAALVLVATNAQAQDLTASVETSFRLSDVDNREIERVTAGAPFRIGLTLTDAISRAPSGGLHLRAFLKPKGERQLQCRELAQLYRKSGRTARGDVDLNGLLLVNLGEDGRLSIADPRLDLATSNLTRVVSFAEPPAAIAGDRSSMSVFVSLPNTGEVRKVLLPGGDDRPFATGLARPTDIFAGENGKVIVHESALNQARVLDAAGDTIELIHIGPGSRVSTSGDFLLLIADDGLVIVLARTDGKERGRVRFQPGFASVAYSDSAKAVIAAVNDRPVLIRRFLDSPGVAKEIAIAAPAALLATAGSDFVLGLDATGRGLSAVDLRDEMMVQAASLDQAVIAIAATKDAAYLQFAGRSAVGVILLDSVRIKTAMAIRRVELGTSPSGWSTTETALMSVLEGGAGVMVGGPDPRNVYFVMQDISHANAPQTAVRFRSDAPRSLVSVDRSFDETAPGHYQAVATVPHGGPWTFVVTAGAGLFAQCVEIDIDGVGDKVAIESAELVLDRSRSTLRIGETSTVVFTIKGPSGQPKKAFAADLMGPWRAAATVAQREDGAYSAEFDFPAAGQYPVIVALRETELAPLVVEIAK